MKKFLFASFFLAKVKKKNYITDINNNGVSQITFFQRKCDTHLDLFD